MSDINKLAAVHLGKTSDGATMQRYETPTQIDPTLLVGIPRVLNRSDYEITAHSFVGYDRWNAYEVSCLLKNGFPVSGKVVLVYNSDSENIVESKSLKLYFNSFNMHKFDTNSISQVMGMVEYQINHDLRSINIVPALVQFVPDFVVNPVKREDYTVRNYEHYVGLESLVVESFNFQVREFKFNGENSSLLETFYATGDDQGQHRYHSSSLRSNCRVTNQPDWGDVYITYTVGMRKLDPQSLFDYIISLRTENHFHEEICEVIYKRLMDALNPLDLMVACNYTRRGGIDINPVRASSSAFLNANINSPRYADIMKEKRQ